MASTGKIGFAEEIAGAEDRQMFLSFITADLVGFATAADDSVNILAGVTFVKENRAFAIGFDGGMIEQVLERARGQKSEQGEIF